MNKVFPLVLLFGGMVLIILGLGTPYPIGDSFVRFFAGSLAEKTVWLLLGGSVATAGGLFGLHYASKA
jgi:hypothetical protein